MAKPRNAKSSGGKEGGALPIARRNLILFAAALGAILLGFFLLAQGSITAAPMLLILGYVVLVPLAIIL